MEGPSWMFNDAPEATARPTQPVKTREEKRQENSLKARLSSASRRLSLDEGESSTDEAPKEEEPVRRGSHRAAAAAARTSLKEAPVNTKLRQGDPGSNSVYDDFAPGTKRKSDSSSGSGKSSKSSKKKKSDGKKK